MKVCITGASLGIGKALTEYFIKKGDFVFGISRKEGNLKKLKVKLGNNFTYQKCDVRNFDEVLHLKKKMDRLKFHPDVIICCAGIFKNDISPEFNINNYKETFNINLIGTINFIEVFLPDFLKKKNGQFIALSSINAFRPNLKSISYPASKAALSMTFRGFDLVYREKGVYFSNIYLGPVDTSMWDGKKSFLVTDSKVIAKKIYKVTKTQKPVYFMPFFSTFLFRVSWLIPDKLYSYISEKIIKNGNKKSYKILRK
ncbi:MAG: SDR family NAD(P)-dependent oxidoreductase [Nanoarchaeota archaeon]